jgi:hypothetical protein
VKAPGFSRGDHYFQFVEGYSQLGRFLAEQLAQPRFHLAREDGTTVLGAPHQVVLEGEDGPCVFLVTRSHTGIMQLPDV